MLHGLPSAEGRPSDKRVRSILFFDEATFRLRQFVGMGRMFENLHEGFAHWAQEAPESSAILAPGRKALSFARLLEELESLSSTFNGFGIGRGDAVAIVMPQSVEQNFLIMGLAVCATAVPLNPGLYAGRVRGSIRVL